MKVYTVWSGEYSDRRMHCVCSSEKVAREMVERIAQLDVFVIDKEDFEEELKYKISQFDIEEYVVDEEYDNYAAGRKPYYVSKNKNGQFHVSEISSEYELVKCNNNSIWYIVFQKMFKVYTWAKDEKHALKIATEQIAQYISTHNIEI